MATKSSRVEILLLLLGALLLLVVAVVDAFLDAVLTALYGRCGTSGGRVAGSALQGAVDGQPGGRLAWDVAPAGRASS